MCIICVFVPSLHRESTDTLIMFCIHRLFFNVEDAGDIYCYTQTDAEASTATQNIGEFGSDIMDHVEFNLHTLW